MSNQRIEIYADFTSYEKKLLREFFSYDRRSRLYESNVGDTYASHRDAMLRMRRTFDVRHTHVNESGEECSCMNREHWKSDPDPLESY